MLSALGCTCVYLLLLFLCFGFDLCKEVIKTSFFLNCVLCFGLLCVKRLEQNSCGGGGGLSYAKRVLHGGRSLGVNAMRRDYL
jgi:hypothetical protein